MSHELLGNATVDTVRDTGQSEQIHHEHDLRHASSTSADTFGSPCGAVEPWGTLRGPSHGTQLPSMLDMELPVSADSRPLAYDNHQPYRQVQHQQSGGTYVEASSNYGDFWNSFDQSNFYRPPPSEDTPSPRLIATVTEPPLKCSFSACNATFQGRYRHGNKGRHERLKHRAVEERTYRCEGHDCGRVFHRQDARLKHYRKCHLELNHARALPRRLQERRRSIGEHKEEWSTSGEIGDWADSFAEADSSKHEYLLPRRESSSDTAMPSHVPPTDVFEPEDMLSLQREDNRLFPEVHSTGLVEATKSDDEPNSMDSRHACPICEGKFRRAADLRRHMQKHEEPKFICEVPDCPHTRGFYRLDKLRDHVHRIHKGTVDTNDDGKLVFNIPDEVPEPQSLYKCTHCRKEYDRQTDLNKHVVRKHDRRYKCDQCDDLLAFGLRADLERHKKSVHKAITDVEVYRCTNPGCNAKGKAFTRRDNFDRHVRRCEEKMGVSSETT